MSTELNIAGPDELVAPDVAVAVDAADTFEVHSDSDARIAGELLTVLAAARKQIEKQRKALVGPVKQLTQTIDAKARELRTPIERAETLLRHQLSIHHEAQEAKRLTAEAERTKADEQAGAISDPGALPAAPVKRVTEQVTMRKHWTYELEDMRKVPDEYKILDVGQVNREIRDGIREIPGLRIYEASTPVVRS
jgi:hypothetical protein